MLRENASRGTLPLMGERLKYKLKASLYYKLVNVPNGAYESDYLIQFTGEQHFGIQLKTTAFQVEDGKRHKAMKFWLSKKEKFNNLRNMLAHHEEKFGASNRKEVQQITTVDDIM